MDEKPLLVQLNWHKDDREGRFLLRRIDEASHMPQPTQEDSSFKRKLSKREKKALKKQEKKEKVKEKDNKDESMAEKLYTGRITILTKIYTILVIFNAINQNKMSESKFNLFAQRTCVMCHSLLSVSPKNFTRKVKSTPCLYPSLLSRHTNTYFQTCIK